VRYGLARFDSVSLAVTIPRNKVSQTELVPVPNSNTRDFIRRMNTARTRCRNRPLCFHTIHSVWAVHRWMLQESSVLPVGSTQGSGVRARTRARARGIQSRLGMGMDGYNHYVGLVGVQFARDWGIQLWLGNGGRVRGGCGCLSKGCA